MIDLKESLKEVKDKIDSLWEEQEKIEEQIRKLHDNYLCSGVLSDKEWEFSTLHPHQVTLRSYCPMEFWIPILKELEEYSPHWSFYMDDDIYLRGDDGEYYLTIHTDRLSELLSKLKIKPSFTGLDEDIERLEQKLKSLKDTRKMFNE
jgi:polyhydroxyalkanoate synthesis regulator phasin